MTTQRSTRASSQPSEDQRDGFAMSLSGRNFQTAVLSQPNAISKLNFPVTIILLLSLIAAIYMPEFREFFKYLIIGVAAFYGVAFFVRRDAFWDRATLWKRWEMFGDDKKGLHREITDAEIYQPQFKDNAVKAAIAPSTASAKIPIVQQKKEVKS